MASLGFGTSITFQSGFFAAIKDVKHSGISRESVDVTNFGSTNGWKEFIPSQLKDAGELEVELLYDTDLEPPIDQAAETVTITFPLKSGETTAAKIQCSAFMTSAEAGVPMEDAMTQSVTLKFTGEPTYTAGS